MKTIKPTVGNEKKRIKKRGNKEEKRWETLLRELECEGVISSGKS